VIFQAPLGVGCVVMVSPRVSLPALLIGLAGCYKRGKRQCNWAFLILLRAWQLKIGLVGSCLTHFETTAR
jgi:uncharacterized membrane protein